MQVWLEMRQAWGFLRDLWLIEVLGHVDAEAALMQARSGVVAAVVILRRDTSAMISSYAFYAPLCALV
jgi:hypothetical protein